MAAFERAELQCRGALDTAELFEHPTMRASSNRPAVPASTPSSAGKADDHSSLKMSTAACADGAPMA
jgi:hypothetical protein